MAGTEQKIELEEISEFDFIKSISNGKQVIRKKANSIKITNQTQNISKYRTVISNCSIDFLELRKFATNEILFDKCEIGDLIFGEDGALSANSNFIPGISKITIKDCRVKKIQLKNYRNTEFTISDCEQEPCELIYSNSNCSSIYLFKSVFTKVDIKIKERIGLINLVSITALNEAIIIVYKATALSISSINIPKLAISGVVDTVATISNSTIQHELLIHNCLFQSLNLDSNIQINRLEVKHTQSPIKIIGGGRYNDILIINILQHPFFIQEFIPYTEVGTLVFAKDQGNIHIVNLNVDTLIINEYSHPIQLTHVNIREIFSALNATLTNSNFNTVNFKNASVKLLNTNLEGSKFINVRWPKNHNLYDFRSENFNLNKDEYVNVLWSIKESYKKLKELNNEQQNRLDTIQFLTQELKMYYRIINIETIGLFRFHRFINSKNIIRFLKKPSSIANWFIDLVKESWTWLKSFNLKEFRTNFTDWIVLATNNLFSGFGLSWVKPLFWWTIFHGILFYFLLNNNNLGIKLASDFSRIDWDATKKGSELFIYLLFPIHDRIVENVITKDEVDIWSWVDFGMRIISPYFIYYFIRGTRKFNLSI